MSADQATETLRTEHPDPQTVDYRTGAQGWGHAFSIHATREDHYRLTGHGPAGVGRVPGVHRIQNGDYALVSLKAGGTARMRFEDVEYYRDPPDMWRASWYPDDPTTRQEQESR